MTVALGFPVGLLLGIVLHRGDFCMHSAMREVLAGRAGPQVCAWAMGLGVQLLLVNALAAAGAFAVVVPPVMPIAAIVGGSDLRSRHGLGQGLSDVRVVPGGGR